MSATLTNKLNAIQSIKDDIKQAIEKKGVTVDGAFDTYPECINSIEAGGGDELAIHLIERSIRDVNIPDGITSIGDYAFAYYGTLSAVTIPASVTSIGEYAFQSCAGLTSVTISDGVTSIGASAFHSCSSLKSVTIPDSVTSISKLAFNSCTGLTSATISSSVTSLPAGMFGACTGLISVTIPNRVTSIGASAFHSCSSLTSVTIPDSVTSIGESAFNSCSSLTSVTIPDSVTSIEGSTFHDCTSLASVIIPSGVTSIKSSAFTGCSSLTSVTIPDSVTSIGQSAFQNCTGLTSVTISDGVTSIDRSTFQNCTGLTSVIIPSSVTSIGLYAFQDCSALTSVTIENSDTKLYYSSNIFKNIASNAILYVPENLLAKYQADTKWTGAFSQIRAIGDEPVAYTITGVSVDQADPEYKELAMQYGETSVHTITFYGTGLSGELDWANIVNVEYSTEDFSDFHFDDVANVADDGTWATLNYQYTTVSAEEGLTSYPAEIRFTCGEFSGTINACIFKVKSYEWDSNNTDTVNNYPSTINATAIVNLGSCNLADNYLNDDAKQRLSGIMQCPVEFEVTNIDDGVSMIDEYTGEYHVTVYYTITPADEKPLTVSLQWEDMAAVEHTFAAAVHISQFTLNDAYAINGDDKVHLTKNENDAVVIPQVGPTLLLPLTGLNEGVNVWNDAAIYSITYDNSGTDIFLVSDTPAPESWDIDGTQYWCVRIDTNNINREQLRTAKDGNNGTIPPLTIHVEINSVSHKLGAALQQTDMALPTGCTQITAGISNKFSLNDMDTYRYIDTNITPTADTIVKAKLGLETTYGTCLIGDRYSDVTDWRLFSQGNIVDKTDPWTIYFDSGHNSDVSEPGNRISVSVPRANIVENDSPKPLTFTISDGSLAIHDADNNEIASATGTKWDKTDADLMHSICIWDARWTGSWDIDIATMYDVQIYDSQAGADLSAPLMHVIPVTVNGETQVFDTVTRKYLYVQNFELS